MLSKESLDKLIEVVNIGAGNASTALAKLIRQRIDINVPEAFVGEVQKASEFMGSSDDVMTVIMVKVGGDTPGVVFITLPPEDALKISQILAGDNSGEKVTDSYNISTLGEVGNIITGAAFTSLAKFLGIRIEQAVPATAVDMVGAVTDTIFAEIGQKSETILIFKVKLEVVEKSITGNMFFIFDPNATNKIITVATNKLKKHE